MLKRQRNIDWRVLHLCRPFLEYCFPHSRQLIKPFHKNHSMIENTTLQIQTSETLENRRLIHDLCLCYKLVHSFARCTISKFLSFIKSRTRGFPSVYAKKSISSLYFFVKLWNSLSPDIISSSTLTGFKYYILSIDPETSFQLFPRGGRQTLAQFEETTFFCF